MTLLKVIEKATLDSFLVAEKDPWNISENGKGTIDRILSQVCLVSQSAFCVYWHTLDFGLYFRCSKCCHLGVNSSP